MQALESSFQYIKDDILFNVVMQNNYLNAILSASSAVLTKTNLIAFLISAGTSIRSFLFSNGRIIVLIPALCAAKTFSLTPPISRTLPLKVTSPVMATNLSTSFLRNIDIKARVMATPAEGPSFLIAPEG